MRAASTWPSDFVPLPHVSANTRGRGHEASDLLGRFDCTAGTNRGCKVSCSGVVLLGRAHATAHSLESNSACSNTVLVACSCLSGG